MTQDLQDTRHGERPAQADAATSPWSLRFTGSGSEYFRIWIVNLLLIVVTLGIYLPWAKVRRLKYFHGNTWVGDAPLGFHGQPRKMLRGYLLVGCLFVLYSLAGNFSPVAGLVALVIVMAVSPALLRASLQFRLANTSWRGLRLRFTGGIRPLYRLLLPALIPLLLGFGLAWLKPESGTGNTAAMVLLGSVLVAVLLASFFGGAWGLWQLKKYQHGHYALGPVQTSLSVGMRGFVGVFLRILGMGVVLMVVATALLAGITLLSGSVSWTLLLSLLPFAFLLVLFLGLKPYAIAQLQNLVWSGTGAPALQFHSALRFGALLRLTLKNWCLMVLTLGLYWPFAAIATARLRLEAITLTWNEDPDALVSHLQGAQGEAAGDAAGDLFGLDVGL